jgi:hypothetical protein
MTNGRQLPVHAIEPIILMIRGQRVILDSDLAALYGVPTKRLNEQVRRNANRFPPDFAFQLASHDIASFKSRSSSPHLEPIDNVAHSRSRSQIATLKRGHNIKYRPYAFTEHGAIMAAAVLNSPQAVEMSVFVVRAFVKMRAHLAADQELARRLAEIDKQLVVHDTALVDLYEKIRPLLLPPDDPPPKPIGFGVREGRSNYRTRNRF